MDYRQLIIPILLVLLIYLIKTNANCYITLGNSVLLILLLSDFIRYENFQVSEQLFMNNKDPIELSQLKQEYEIGTKTVTDLVDEESKLLSANVDFLNSKKDYLVNYFIILSLEGSLLNSFENYLPEIN